MDLKSALSYPVPKKYIEMKQKLIVGGVSSTELRKRIRQVKKEGGSTSTNAKAALNIAGLASKAVIEYIIANNFYL